MEPSLRATKHTANNSQTQKQIRKKDGVPFSEAAGNLPEKTA
jgi:hypothetical protein